MKSLATFSLLLLTSISGQWQHCDQSADIVFVQDLQESMRRPLRHIEDDIEDVIEEFEEVFRRPRFAVITFKERSGSPCVDIPVSFTRSDDYIEDTYERMRAVTKPSFPDYGSPLSGLLAALSWPEVQWQSSNRFIVLFTNNMPLAANDTISASAEKAFGCHRAVESPLAEAVLTQLKESKTTVLFVIPDASMVVSTYWTHFNANLGQDASLLTTRSKDLDDWIEHKKYFFSLLKGQNCARIMEAKNVSDVSTIAQPSKQ